MNLTSGGIKSRPRPIYLSGPTRRRPLSDRYNTPSLEFLTQHFQPTTMNDSHDLPQTKADSLKLAQQQWKQAYATDPAQAVHSLQASGDVDFANLGCKIDQPRQWSDAGLHERAGGDGSFACPVEILLGSWVACAGVTLAAVAHSMKLNIERCRITATGTMDFRGTLGVDRTAPVGLTHLKLHFDISASEPMETIQKLIQLTERYCVVHQTLKSPPELETSCSLCGN